jgi:hypothetical protein
MQYRLLAAAMLATGAVAGCAEPSISGTLTVRVLENSSSDLDRTADILRRRFTEILPSRRSSVEASVADRTITFTFRGSAPAEDDLHYLTFTRGELVVGPADTPASSWISDHDVLKAEVIRIGEDPYVQVWLSDNASRRLADLTSRNVDRILLVQWDGNAVVTAPILGTIEDELVFNAPSLSEGRLMKIVLEAGRLPMTIENADYKHGV